MKEATGLSLCLLTERLAVARLEARSDFPAWARGDGFLALVRTPEEISVVCAEAAVPANVQSERGWRAFKVQGPLEFSLVGVLAAIANPLAQAGVSIFVISTFDTDYILVKEAELLPALVALQRAGHAVVTLS